MSNLCQSQYVQHINEHLILMIQPYKIITIYYKQPKICLINIRAHMYGVYEVKYYMTTLLYHRVKSIEVVLSTQVLV